MNRDLKQLNNFYGRDIVFGRILQTKIEHTVCWTWLLFCSKWINKPFVNLAVESPSTDQKVSPMFLNIFTTFKRLHGKINWPYFCAERQDVKLCDSFCCMWVGPVKTEILAKKPSWKSWIFTVTIVTATEEVLEFDEDVISDVGQLPIKLYGGKSPNRKFNEG